jgi:hypothetical protein
VIELYRRSGVGQAEKPSYELVGRPLLIVNLLHLASGRPDRGPLVEQSRRADGHSTDRQDGRCERPQRENEPLSAGFAG